MHLDYEKKLEAYEYGRTAEAIVAQFLEKMGWRILERGYRIKGAEIDLVALDGATLVFVEVRARRGGFDPLETVRAEKLRRMVYGARFYAASKGITGLCPSVVDEIRFDFVAVEARRVTRHIRGQFFL